jgi:hypothetical protein
MPAVLMGVGVLLMLLAFGLAFTIYGEISFVAGIACIVTSGVMVVMDGHRVRALGSTPPRQQQPPCKQR